MRRGVLYSVKPWFVARLRHTTESLMRSQVSPDIVTLIAVPIAVLVASALVLGTTWPLIWLLVPPLTLLLMALNAIDGDLARSSGATTTRGAALNEMADRAGDLLLIGPAFLIAGPWIGSASLFAVMAAELVASIGWGVTGERVLGGLMGKPDRAALLALGAPAAAVAGQGVLESTYLLIALGSVATCVQRAHLILVGSGRLQGGSPHVS